MGIGVYMRADTVANSTTSFGVGAGRAGRGAHRIGFHGILVLRFRQRT